MFAHARIHVRIIALSLLLLVDTLGFVGSTESSGMLISAGDGQIVLPKATTVNIYIDAAVTNLCSGDLYVEYPDRQLLVADYANATGQVITLGPYPVGTQLVFAIEPLSWCAGYRYLSSDSSHAIVLDTGEGGWVVEWEDLPPSYYPDYDFDDLIMSVWIQDAKIDGTQNLGEWASATYAYGEPKVDTIRRWGSALVSMRNLLELSSFAAIDPIKLNGWIMENRGYTKWSSVVWPTFDLFGASHFVSDPLDIGGTIPPMDLKYQGTILSGTPNFTRVISENLGASVPVILEFQADESRNRAHYLLVTGTIDSPSGTEYVVKDPYFGSEELFTLGPADSRINSARLFGPDDQVRRSWLIIHAPATVDLILSDKYGRRVGYDPDSGQKFEEIPGAYYRHEPKLWDPTGGADYADALGGGLVVEIPEAIYQTYGVKIFRTGLSAVEVRSLSSEGTLLLAGLSVPGRLFAGNGEYTIVTGNDELEISFPDDTVSVTKDTGTVEITYPDGSNLTIHPYNIFLPAASR